MGMLRLKEEDLHRLDVGERKMLFHVPTTSLFELDALAEAVLNRFAGGRQMAPEELYADLCGGLPASVSSETISEVVSEFQGIGLLMDAEAPLSTRAPLPSFDRVPLTTVVLNVNTGCNLSCSYCYKEDLTKPVNGTRMDFETAKRSIEMLLAESPDRKTYNVVFFGGEPLLEFKLIRQVVSYARERFGALGKMVDFSLTTNATLLNDEIVDFLITNRIGVTVSMDGPKALHDKNRKTVGGKGTYDVIAKNVRTLLSRYTTRPIGARVTLTHGVTDVIGIWDHLKNDLGFGEVGFSPVTSGSMGFYDLTDEEIRAVFDGMTALGEIYEAEALKGNDIGFSNMHQMVTNLHEGTSKALPCGAGVAMLAVDAKGDLNLCHRFTGSDLETFGSLDNGPDRSAIRDFVNARVAHKHEDGSDTGCVTCRIRGLCAGGCYHESYARFNDPIHPTYHYCDLMREWVDVACGVYIRLMQGNPAFIENMVKGRASLSPTEASAPVAAAGTSTTSSSVI